MYGMNRWIIQAERGWDELGHRDGHMYTMDIMHNTGN